MKQITSGKVDEYVDKGDIKDGEVLTDERIVAELIRWTRVVNSGSYEYERLTPLVLTTVLEHYGYAYVKESSSR